MMNIRKMFDEMPEGFLPVAALVFAIAYALVVFISQGAEPGTSTTLESRIIASAALGWCLFALAGAGLVLMGSLILGGMYEDPAIPRVTFFMAAADGLFCLLAGIGNGIVILIMVYLINMAIAITGQYVSEYYWQRKSASRMNCGTSYLK